MGRILLTLAYDGAAFAGWQSQAGGGSVQDAIEGALATVAGCPLRIHGAGRTDAGVHALDQRCHFDPPPTRMQPREWVAALNSHLPPEVRVLRARAAPPSFHARFSATGKIYRYRIRNAPILPPHEARRAWLVTRPLDIGRMKAAARVFLGTHDFSGFAANRGKPVADPRRAILGVTVARRGTRIDLTFQGTGFLYKMARMMTAAIVECGLGKREPGHLAAILGGSAPRWTRVAPADGLTLLRTLYSDHRERKSTV